MNLLIPVTAVLPILLYMLAGQGLKMAGRISDSTAAQVNKIIFSYCFPFLMFNNIYRTRIEEVLNGPYLITMVALVLLVSLLSVLLIPRFFQPKPVQGSMIQAIIRGNSILFALPVVSAISGPDRTGLASLAIAVIVPIYHLVCTLVLEMLRGHSLKPWPIIRNLLKNPLIIGALAGILFKLLHIQLMPVLDKLVADIAGLITPVSLVMLGSGLKFSDTRRYAREIRVVSLVKLVLIPLVFVLTVKLLGFDKVGMTTALALGAVPVAVSTYVMAIEMDADGVLAGQLVAATSVLSIFTVFLWVFALYNLGWIG